MNSASRRLAFPAFDINATCLGFVAARDTLSWPLAAGHYQRVLIVASDLASPGLNWQELESSAIFGEGAAAPLVGKSPCHPGSRILASDFMTLSEGASLCEIPAFGSRHHPNRKAGAPAKLLPLFRMDGKGSLNSC